ncbi:25792_t:CDS:2, partial [Gigaspora rosea]
QVQSRLKEKQCYAKVFGLTKALVNKTIKLELDEKLIALLEKFKNNEIMPSLQIKNLLTKKRKERPQGAQHILFSIEVNQLSTKSRSNRYKYCGEQGHNIRSYKNKHNDFELESD